MSKFKAGDKVTRFKHMYPDYPQGGMKVWDVDTVIAVRDQGLTLDLDKFGAGHSASCFELAYPNPPHKHAEVIKAWADGAVSQLWNSNKRRWEDLVSSSPVWYEKHQYRIKPVNPNADKIAEIESTISKLQQQLKELKDGGDS